jgi:hypothetical protein
MADIIVGILLITACIYATVNIGSRGLKGLREKRLEDRNKNWIEGKDATSVARLYLFIAAISGLCAIIYLLLILRKIWFVFPNR